jgi:hypothetical protein
MASIFKRVSDNLSTRKVTAKRSGLGLVPAVKQGEYGPEYSLLGHWGVHGYQREGGFNAPPFSINDIDTAMFLDGVVGRAIAKYIQLIFKEGFVLEGKNQSNVDYIKQRFAIFENTAEGGLDWMLRNIASDIVKYGNCVMVKSRYRKETLPQVNRMHRRHLGASKKVTGVTAPTPISGFWYQEFSQMSAKLDTSKGIPVQYQQEAPDKSTVKWPAKEIVHFTFDKPAKSIWGRSFIIPVLDDIKLLRSMENHASDLFYRYLNPLLHATVGKGDPITNHRAMKGEVKKLSHLINTTPPQATLVTDGRVEVSQVTGSGEAIPAIDYLKYFTLRVLMGLGVSPVIMGEGDTANRGTSDALVAQMRDNIQTFQEVIAAQFTKFVINELLMEAGVNVLRPEEQVHLKFNEIDTDLLIKKRNEITQRWITGLITHPEARREMGMEELKKSDESGLHINMVEIPLVKAQGEVQKDVAKVTASMRPTTTSTTTKKTTGAKNANANKNKPANQHKTRSGPKKSTEGVGTELRKQIADMLTNQLTWTISAAIANGESELDPVRDIDAPVMVAVTNLIERGFKPKSAQYTIRTARNVINEYIQGNIDYIEVQKKILNNVLPTEMDDDPLNLNYDLVIQEEPDNE